jgi:hypothetical protein
MRRRIVILSGLIATGIVLPSVAAQASGLDDKQIQIMAKVFNFLEKKPPSGSTILILTGAADLSAAKNALSSMSVVEGTASNAPGAFAVLVSSPSDAKAVGASNAQAIIISGDVGCVDSGSCMIAIETQPKVSIYTSRAAASKAGVNFDPNFKMLITEH